MMDLLKRFDAFQFRHRTISFVVAVIKKYGDDRAGRNAALISYYMFISLFPLMFWLSMLSGWLSHYDPTLAKSLIHGATNYFPVLGNQLFRIGHNAHYSLLGMIVPALVALYGARGVALVFRSIVNDIWGVPQRDQLPFPQSWYRGVAIVLIGGGGFVLTAAASSWAQGQGRGALFRLVIWLMSVVLLTGVFMAILRLSLPPKTHVNRILGGALLMAIALAILQYIGGYLVAHQLKHYTDTYTALFSTTLGLLAWIFLVAQVLLYSVVVTAVASHQLWPRHLIED